MIEKLVLIVSSCLLEAPTQLLKDYRVAATDINPLTRHERVKKLLEDVYASPSRLLPALVDLFDYTIEKPGVKYAFEAAFDNSTTTQIGLEEIRQLKIFLV